MTPFQQLMTSVMSAQTEEELAEAIGKTEHFLKTDKSIVGAGIISNGEFMEIKREEGE